MNLLEFLRLLLHRAEMWLVGPLPPDIRRNMHVEFRGAATHSVMGAIIAFIPIILRRAGASTEQVAYYHAITTLGLLTTGVSIWLMRRYGMKRVVLVCWVLGRGALIFTVFATNSLALLAIFTFFWLIETWPSPGYMQTMEVIYPMQQRGRIMAAVRVVMLALMLILTPLAGWILDRWGYRALLPFAGVSGVVSGLIFFPMIRKASDTMTAPIQPMSALWHILLADRRMQIYLAGAMLFGLGLLMSTPLYPAVQVDRLNLSYTEAGLLGLVQSFFWFLGYLFGGRILDKLGGIRTLQIVFLINAFAPLAYIWATQGWMLLPSFAALGLVTAGADVVTMYTVIYLAGPERVPAYSSLNFFVFGIRGLIGPFIGPFLVSVGWPMAAVFGLSIVLTLLGAGVLNFVGKAPAAVGPGPVEAQR